MSANSSDWIDISIPLKTDMVHWPGDPSPTFQRLAEISNGDDCNVTAMKASVHTGTHMDAPLHFLDDGEGMETWPPEATIGPCRVIEVSDEESIKRQDLEPFDLQTGERLLIKTFNSTRCWNDDEFHENFVYISQEAAAYMVERGIRTVGVDYLSVGGFFKDGVETHQHLLRARIWIIEGLNLSAIQPGNYDLNCLPLKIPGSDGAPARALLRARQ